MDVAERGRTRVLSALALAVVIAGCGTLAFSREPSPSSVDCYRDDFGGQRASLDAMGDEALRAVAVRCRGLAGNASRPRRETLYANFYAGKAWRRLGERVNEPQAGQIWKDAEAALRDVADFNGPRAPDRATQGDLRFELTRIESVLELSLVLSRQGRSDEAIRRSREAIALYSTYAANPNYTAFKADADGLRVSSSFALAAIYLAQVPSDEISAMNALRVFTDKNLDNHPNAAAARGQIMEIGRRLGASELAIGSPESLRRAQDYFQRALEAGEAANRQAAGAPMADLYVSLGRVYMGSAQLAGPDTPRGCDRRPAETERVDAALKLFQRASDTAEGQRWAGCAQLALGDLAGAVASFRQATAFNSNTAEAQLSLARALYREATTPGSLDPAGSWRQSRASFQSAIAIMDAPANALRVEPAAKARVRVELADVDLAYLASPFIPPGEKAAVVNHAESNLRAAIALAPTQADAYLRLGMMQLGEGDFSRKLSLEGADGAGANLNKALQFARDNTSLKAEAYYLLSRYEVRKVQAQRGTPNRREAVRNADRAAELGDEQRGPTYFTQACEVRLTFGIADGGGTQYCVANESRDGPNYPLALLHEGMYFLSKAKTAKTALEQSSDWEYALLAFSKGERYLQERGIGGDWNPLRARLVTGRGLALGCSGLRQLGLDAIGSVPVSLAGDARDFFDRYNVRVCAPSRRI